MSEARKIVIVLMADYRSNKRFFLPNFSYWGDLVFQTYDIGNDEWNLSNAAMRISRLATIAPSLRGEFRHNDIRQGFLCLTRVLWAIVLPVSTKEMIADLAKVGRWVVPEDLVETNMPLARLFATVGTALDEHRSRDRTRTDRLERRTPPDILQWLREGP